MFFSRNFKFKVMGLILLQSIFFSGGLFLARGLQYQEVISPIIKNPPIPEEETNMLSCALTNKKGDEVLKLTSAISRFLYICAKDKNILASFDRLSYQKNEQFFAKLIDKETGKVLDRGYFYKENFFGEKTAELRMQYYCNSLEIQIYKQNVSDPEFTEREENFIGKSSFFAPGVAAFKRKRVENASIKAEVIGEDDLEVVGIFHSRNVPNYYSINALTDYGSSTNLNEEKEYFYLGEIVPLSGNKDLLKDKDRFVNDSVYWYNEDSDSIVYVHHFNFYLPEGIDEFEFRVYKNKACEEDLIKKYRIKLIKK